MILQQNRLLIIKGYLAVTHVNQVGVVVMVVVVSVNIGAYGNYISKRLFRLR